MISGIGGGSLLPLKLGFFCPVNSDESRWWAQYRKKSRPPQLAGLVFWRIFSAPAPYCFGEVRVATLALLIFTALSGWRSCGVVTTKFSDHVVTFRSSPTVFADTPVPASASTLIPAGKPPRAMWSAAMLLGLYRMRASSLPGAADCRTAYNVSTLAATGRRHFRRIDMLGMLAACAVIASTTFGRYGSAISASPAANRHRRSAQGYQPLDVRFASCATNSGCIGRSILRCRQRHHHSAEGRFILSRRSLRVLTGIH
jgi:hypothetical protein